MIDAYRTAYVYVRETFAGILKETDYGYYFKYDKEYLKNPDSKKQKNKILPIT